MCILETWQDCLLQQVLSGVKRDLTSKSVEGQRRWRVAYDSERFGKVMSLT